MHEMPCAGINGNTIFLGIRIMEKNAIQRGKKQRGKMPYKGVGIMPYFRPGNQKECHTVG